MTNASEKREILITCTAQTEVKVIGDLIGRQLIAIASESCECRNELRVIGSDIWAALGKIDWDEIRKYELKGEQRR